MTLKVRKNNMLSLEAGVNGEIIIGDDPDMSKNIRLVVLYMGPSEFTGKQVVRLGFDCDKKVAVNRLEVFESKLESGSL